MISKESLEFLDKLEKLYELLNLYYKNDDEKAYLWLKTKNPLLGDMSPLETIYKGNVDKLIEFVKNCLEGNLP